MLLDDDEQSVKKKSVRDLSSYSIDALDTYIQELEAEIGRAQAEKTKKAAADAAAKAFFKPKPV